ncbi:ankyrin [Annulohypoxylon truncatum]|uniref:ankyrin n=1 Tax=Annulohypoxylon truncatum TaxID=327061 RepID=UPI002007C0BB|nr:ankyrin [Annulohypoxylon truncatum]KAI1212510.1 ankyrin [Annulohypoxylon truncatum]
MEVISAIGSFIAIGQALAAIPKIINTLRSVVKARQELLQLLNDVELLNSFGTFIRETMVDLDEESKTKLRIPQLGLSLIERVRVDLESVVPQLEDLCRACQLGRKGNSPMKVARIQWFRHRKRIISLSERARKNCTDLQTILSLTSFFASTVQGRMIIDIHTVVMSQSHSHARLSVLQLLSQLRYIGDVSSHAVDTNGKDDVPEGGVNLGFGGYNQPKLQDIIGETSPQLFPDEKATEEPLLQFTAALPRACVRGCRCQCHSPTSRTRPHPAVSSIHGWLKSAYNIIPRLGTRRCDVFTCQRAKSPVYVNFRFPILFCSRRLEASLSFDSVAGVGASLHLRVARELPLNASIWGEISMGKVDMVRLRFSRREISPLDVAVFEEYECIMEYVFLFRHYEMMELFLQDATSIIRGTDAAKRLVATARYRLYAWRLSESEQNILQKVVALDEDIDEYWPIHEAIKGGGDLAAILRESSEDINSLDSFGYAPLHWAALKNDVIAIQHLISHGANPNIHNASRDTPLTKAIRCGQLNCIPALIDGGCDINAICQDRVTALSYLTMSDVEGSAEMVNVLLENGAIFIPDKLYGDSAMHYLAQTPSAAEVVEKFQLLVQAGAEVGQRNKQGCTPLDWAWVHNNPTMARLLMDAGCELNDTPGNQNALEIAALYSNVESMNIIGETTFTMDVRWRDEYGDTPLDVFEWRMNTSLLPGQFQTPGDEDIETFGRLLSVVRDRYLNTEIQTLESAVQHLKEHDCILARETLSNVIEEKIKWNIPAEYRTFRAVDVQIKEEMIEAAIESLEEFMEVSRLRIGTDPFSSNYCRACGLKYRGLVVENTK